MSDNRMTFIGFSDELIESWNNQQILGSNLFFGFNLDGINGRLNSDITKYSPVSLSMSGIFLYTYFMNADGNPQAVINSSETYYPGDTSITGACCGFWFYIDQDTIPSVTSIASFGSSTLGAVSPMTLRINSSNILQILYAGSTTIDTSLTVSLKEWHYIELCTTALATTTGTQKIWLDGEYYSTSYAPSGVQGVSRVTLSANSNIYIDSVWMLPDYRHETTPKFNNPAVFTRPYNEDGSDDGAWIGSNDTTNVFNNVRDPTESFYNSTSTTDNKQSYKFSGILDYVGTQNIESVSGIFNYFILSKDVGPTLAADISIQNISGGTTYSQTKSFSDTYNTFGIGDRVAFGQTSITNPIDSGSWTIDTINDVEVAVTHRQSQSRTLYHEYGQTYVLVEMSSGVTSDIINNGANMLFGCSY